MQESWKRINELLTKENPSWKDQEELQLRIYRIISEISNCAELPDFLWEEAQTEVKKGMVLGVLVMALEEIRNT